VEPQREKSLFYYGRPYHLLIDGLTRLNREKILERVPRGSRVLDAGCGTGQLAFGLRDRRDCEVVGVDLSRRMIDYASRRPRSRRVTFVRGDITDLSQFADAAFDVGILAQVVHELPQPADVAALREVWRTSRRVIVQDYAAPLPRNIPSAVSRFIEASLGRDHHQYFLDYIARGGILAVVEDAGLTRNVVERSTFSSGTSQIVVLARSVSAFPPSSL
jgi:ubiquinone/menaquinone biosynthesis C-methylase UbiE